MSLLKSLVLITFSLVPTSFVGTESSRKITVVVIVVFKGAQSRRVKRFEKFS